MKTFVVALAVALLLLSAVATLAPAALLDGRLAAATHGSLRLTDTAGTVWNGRGKLTGDPRIWSLPVQWKLDPIAALRGGVSITLQASEGGDVPRGGIAWRDDALTLEGVALTLPAAALNGMLAAGNTLAFGGYIAFDTPHLRWNGREGDGAAMARWSSARVAGNVGTVALGTVSVNFAVRGERLEGRIENRGGDVRIDGEIALSNMGFDVNATLVPLPSAPPEATRALAALGTPDASGAVRVQWRSNR